MPRKPKNQNRHAPILYWFPGELEPPAEFAHRFARAHTMARNSEGPVKNKRGCLIAPTQDIILYYAPTRQRWDNVAEGVWIGADMHADPARFIREKPFPGYRIELGDANEWLIPVANPFVETCTLPFWERLLKGEWVREVHDRYCELSKRAADFAAMVRDNVLKGGEPKFEIEDTDLRRLIADVIALNYDVTLEELSVLRVFSPETYWPAINAFIDWPEMQQTLVSIMEEAKSTDPFGDSETNDTNATAPGAPDTSDNIDQHALTSCS